MRCKPKKTFQIYYFCTPLEVLDLDTDTQLIFFGVKNVPQCTLPKMCIRPLLFQPFSVVPKNGHTHNCNLLVFAARMSSCMCVWPFLDIKICFSLICKRYRSRCDYGYNLNKDCLLLLNYLVCFLMFIFFFSNDVRYSSCTWHFQGIPWKTSITE